MRILPLVVLQIFEIWIYESTIYDDSLVIYILYFFI